MNTTHLYQVARTGRIKHLTITANGNQLITEWWTSKDGKDGKKQSTTDTISGVNEGKANETTPEQQCYLEWERKVVTKKEEGYVDSLAEAKKKATADCDITSVLPTEFAPSKPVNKLPASADPFDGTWYAERKFDGQCLLLHNTGTESVVYSRRMIPITSIVSCVPNLQQHLNQLPAGTLVLGELVAFDSNNIEDSKSLKGITHDKTEPEKAQARYDALIEQGYNVMYIPFDILFLDGEDVSKKPFSERKAMTEKIFNHNRAVKPFQKSLADAAMAAGWEGFILRREDDTVDFSMNGKPRRVGAYKYKFIYEADCVVVGLATGNGKNQNRVARFKLAQYDSNGNLIGCGWAGAGRLKETEQDEITAEFAAKGYTIDGEIALNPSDYFGVEIEFQSRQPMNDKGERCFEFPIPIRVRYDKNISECTVE